MLATRWAQLPLWPVCQVLFRLAHVAAEKGDRARVTRFLQQAGRFPRYRRKTVKRLAKYLLLDADADPNREDARAHAGIDALLGQIDEVEFPMLRDRYQGVVAFSLIRRGKPLPESLRTIFASRDDDDAVIMMRLADDPHADVHTLLKPIFERHGLPVPPLIADGSGVDRFGFPDCPPAHGDKVTVAMTAFNAERTIEHAIRSVVNQTWRNLEIFIIDDNSTDGTAAIIERYASMDDRIIPLHNANNMGTYRAKNRALERATGRWFTCHDADDWSHPMKIERQVEALRRSDLVANTSQWVRSSSAFPVRLRDRGSFIYRNCSSLLFRTDTVRDSIGYYDSVKVNADVEMIDRLATAFGERQLRDERLFLAIGRVQVGTLTSAEKFEVGFRKKSQLRKIYTASYRRWHRTSKALYIPIKHEPRRFPAPEALIASAN